MHKLCAREKNIIRGKIGMKVNKTAIQVLQVIQDN